MFVIRLRRHALAVALPALLLAAAAPAHAGPPRAASGRLPERTGNSASAVDRVADFYGAYIDVLNGQGHSHLADALREFYLTDDLRARLGTWEKEHGGDGVLRAQGLPTSWAVAYNDSGMGHVWTRVTLTWTGNGRSAHTVLAVQSDQSSLRISDIHEDT
ncbi:hypothetical protein LKL35_32945 [Streptomyces sp. ET3-23]|uniref:hypothetical protein n=1 Tax=Streptomyces sp. ET3-23 TaxID=2885643 RepID=UPI001D11B7A6|nr:hypothetical protein [Streptomyces sp. ET3-23]MCC2280192.1 hypothetical protein [Streptomyces sp. ET3-23]